jgi:hypothetical protein
MSKMGSHDPFGHLKHKLWPKERSGVKLTFWLSTFKSQELPQFPRVQVACDIPLKSSQRGLQLCLKPHLNRRSSQKVMGPQSCGSFDFGNFGTLNWESHDKVQFGWSTKYTIKGKVVASSKSESWWVLWVWVCPWLFLAPKVFQLCTNQLVVWFVQIHVSD